MDEKGFTVVKLTFETSTINNLTYVLTTTVSMSDVFVFNKFQVTVTTITIEIAIEYCQTTIAGTSSISDCRDILGQRYQDAVDFCARDYVVSIPQFDITTSFMAI